MASPPTVSSQKPRRHPGRHPAPPSPLRPNRTSGFSNGNRPTSPAGPAPTVLATRLPAPPRPPPPEFPAGAVSRAGSASDPPNLRRVRAKRLPLQAYTRPPSCRRRVLRRRTAAPSRTTETERPGPQGVLPHPPVSSVRTCRSHR